MKYLLSLCAAMLLLCVADLPSGYYWLVRIVVTVGAMWIVVKEPVQGLNFWRVAFGLIAIVFNPILPVYLYDKGLWLLVDIAAAVLFIVKWYNLGKKHVSD